MRHATTGNIQHVHVTSARRRFLFRARDATRREDERESSSGGGISRNFAARFFPLCSSTPLATPLYVERKALGGGGRPLPRLQPDLEALRAFEDDVGLESEIGLLDVRLDAVVPHNRGQDDLQLEHGVFAAYAGTRPGGERHEGVVMSIGGLLRQEVVRVEDLRIRIDVRLPVHLEGRNYHRGPSRDRIVSRH